MEHNARQNINVLPKGSAASSYVHIMLKVENIYSIHHLEANACISRLGRLFRDSWVVQLWVSVCILEGNGNF